MKLVERYLRQAEECRKLAARVSDAQRAAILTICDMWQRLADGRRRQLDAAPPGPPGGPKPRH